MNLRTMRVEFSLSRDVILGVESEGFAYLDWCTSIWEEIEMQSC